MAYSVSFSQWLRSYFSSKVFHFFSKKEGELIASLQALTCMWIDKAFHYRWSIYIHILLIASHVLTANHITRLPTATLSILINQIARQGFWIFNWLNHHVTPKMASAWVVETSVTKNSLGIPIIQMIFFNQGMSLLGSNHFLQKKETQKFKIFPTFSK